MAVVEDERRQPGGREALGVSGQALVVHGGEAVAEHDGAGRPLGMPEPGGDVAAQFQNGSHCAGNTSLNRPA